MRPLFFLVQLRNDLMSIAVLKDVKEGDETVLIVSVKKEKY